MAKSRAKKETEKLEEGEHGLIFLEWEFSERPRYERGRLWYSFMIVLGTGLLLYALVSANFLFALIVVMFALVLYVSTIFEPSLVRFAITEDGIEVGDAFIPYRDVEKFWFYYDPPAVKNLYIDFKSALRPRIRVDLVDQNPNRVREVIARFVREDLEQIDEPISEIIGRIFKI